MNISISRYILFLILVIVSVSQSVSVSAQAKWNKTYQNYIDIYKNLAIEQMLEYNIPASITLAQGLLESGAGRSSLATLGNNHFGIKCHDWTGPSMRRDDDAPNECFRVYSNPRESYIDHSKFLHRQRYSRLFQLKRTDYKGWAKGLKACGYATSPTYAVNLINIIETYKLYEFDTKRSFDRFIYKHSAGAKGLLEGQMPHEIFSFNDNYYVFARKGDTFKSLSKELGISQRKLARYNERDRKDELSEGDVVYMKKKKTHAPKQFKNKPHTIKNGESMYSIAQSYGMRLSSLYKKNKLSPDYSPKVGDKLKVY